MLVPRAAVFVLFLAVVLGLARSTVEVDNLLLRDVPDACTFM